MASGCKSPAIGSFYGTGAEIEVRTVGFRPRSVKVFNVSGNCFAHWMEGMADASAQKVVDSGSGTSDVSLITSNGITPLSDGFKLGADTDLNASTELVRFEAYE